LILAQLERYQNILTC